MSLIKNDDVFLKFYSGFLKNPSAVHSFSLSSGSRAAMLKGLINAYSSKPCNPLLISGSGLVQHWANLHKLHQLGLLQPHLKNIVFCLFFFVSNNFCSLIWRIFFLSRTTLGFLPPPLVLLSHLWEDQPQILFLSFDLQRKLCRPKYKVNPTVPLISS